MNYEPIIGLEVHVELGTKSKMFCGCPADHFGREPNTATCPVCLGLPGALPVPNKKAIDWTILLGLALGCEVATESKFDRKNYFYPDLPKGYQISQYDQPLAINGLLQIRTQNTNPNDQKNTKIVRIRRVHIEEDTGKLQHAVVEQKKVTLVDFNRSGVPLVEIVTEPDFRSLEEVDVYLKELQRIIKNLGISQAEMEKGTMRIEPSISILPISNTTNIQYPIPENKLPKYRVELKNINSFRFARKALEYEIKRQAELLEKGETPKQQTRGWNEDKNATVPQREKEEAHDYRYFPEPDIPPMRFSALQISNLKTQIPEMPRAKVERFMKDFMLNDHDAAILTESKELAQYFENATIDAKNGVYQQANVTPKEIANWIINKKIDMNKIHTAALIQNIASNKVFTVDEANIKLAILDVLDQNVDVVADYKSGKESAIHRLFGKVLQSLKGNPDKQVVMKVLKECLHA